MNIDQKISGHLMDDGPTEKSDRRSDDDSSDMGAGKGTRQDEVDMQRLGRTPQLKRTFRSLSILGLTTMTMISWTGIFSSLSFIYLNGGRGGAIYVYIAGWLGEAIVVASLAETASMAPSSSGQYHWVSEFAPPSIQKPLSYFAGWLAALTWQTYVATPAYQAAEIILILANLNNPGYVPTKWQETLPTIAITICVFAFNVWGAKILPMTEIMILVVLMIGFFAALVPLWALAPTVPASEAFGSFVNYGGWSSVGGACVVGQIFVVGALTGCDGAAHLSEEVQDASKTVPHMMMGTVALNGLMGFVVTITLSFIIQDIKTQVLDSPFVYPFIGIFKDSVGSNAGVTGMTVLIVVLSVFCSVSSMAAASRQAWAFARDNGLPFSGWFTKLTRVSSTPLPVRSMIASLGISLIIASMNLGGPAVFDSVYGLGSGAASTTYLIGIASVLWRRLFGQPLPSSRFSLGRFGIPINIISVLFLLQYLPIAYFPLFNDPTVQEMNWGIALFGGAAVLAIAYYIAWGWKFYVAPRVHVRLE